MIGLSDIKIGISILEKLAGWVRNLRAKSPSPLQVGSSVCLSNLHVFLALKLDPATVELEKSLTRDVTSIGHWGTGDLEVVLRKPADFEKAKSLIERAYQEN